MSSPRIVPGPVVLAAMTVAQVAFGLASANAAPIHTTSMVPPSAQNASGAVTTAGESNPDWAFTVTPYFWLTRLSGSVDSGAETAVVDAPFSELFERFDGGGAIAFEGRRGAHGFLLDLNVVRLEQDLTGPANLEIDLEQTVA